LIAPTVERGHLRRSPHPTDGRARLLELSAAGRDRLEAAIPAFTTAYRALLGRLALAETDTEAMYDALDALRTGIAMTNDLIEGEFEADA
jgi:DNA-binding MarR family transcriptional regulator